jgi:hypothetical protein
MIKSGVGSATTFFVYDHIMRLALWFTHVMVISWCRSIHSCYRIHDSFQSIITT